MIKKPFISLLAALLLAIIPASGADDLAGKVKKILRQRVTPTEAVDSALSVIIGDGRPSPEDFAGVEQAMEQELLPFVGRHDELTPLKLSEVYWEYARLCSTLGAERIDDYRRLSDTALEYARQADDPYMIATINDRRGVIEERYGDSSKAFGYFAEALDNYRRDPEKGGREGRCLPQQPGDDIPAPG